MKKMMNRAFGFTMAGIFAGAFYREFTKFLGYTGETTMSVMHTHLFALGAIFSFILLLLTKTFDLSDYKNLERDYNLYTLSVIGVVLMMFARGVLPVLDIEVTRAIDMSISGISGVIHIGITIVMFMLFNGIRKSVNKQVEA